MQPVRLCYLVTHPMSTCFLRGQLRYMRECGYETTVITSPGKELERIKEDEGVNVRCVPIERHIRPIRDIQTLIRLYGALRSIQPHIVHAGTPKAGLLGMLAAWAARVPVRIYMLHGLRLETATGLKRRILILTERVASACANRIICVSRSLANRYLQLGHTNPRKVVVLGAGSCNGVDVARLARTNSRVAESRQVRNELGISPGEPVIGYVGRLARDKGIADLVEAFQLVRHRIPSAWLLLVGDPDTADAPDETTSMLIRTHPRIISTGFVEDVAPYFHAMHVFAFPSYREGFGNAALEAQTAGLPVVGYRVTGVVDAIVDGATGRLVPLGAVDKLAAALVAYINDPKLARAHGARGLRRAKIEFAPERVWARLRHEYSRLLQKRSTQRSSSYRLVRRVLDLGAAALALLVLPFIAALALLVRCRLGKPVLFWQRRAGLHGHPFWMPKFRTMTEQRGPTGELLPDDRRLTPLGRFLRASSLDELPELWNVFRGEISLIGPRPLLMEYLDRYTPEQARRHQVKPGITGWAQVHGRNSVSWNERFALDLWYVDHQSLWLDLKILVLTIFTVLSRRGVSAEGHATMPRFDEQSAANSRYDRAA